MTRLCASRQTQENLRIYRKFESFIVIQLKGSKAKTLGQYTAYLIQDTLSGHFQLLLPTQLSLYVEGYMIGHQQDLLELEDPWAEGTQKRKVELAVNHSIGFEYSFSTTGRVSSG